MPEVEIRRAMPTDAAAIAQLVNLAYRPPPGEEGWTHESALVDGDRISLDSVNSALENTIVLVGVSNSVVVGCVQIEVNGRAVHIGMLAVDPMLQTSGVGKLLLERAEAFSAQHLQAKEAVLIVIAARIELIEFYQRRKYKITGEGLEYPIEAGVGVPGEEAMKLVVLKKALNPAMYMEKS
ncbi:GNAT family N-acetyltransferase [Marinimicrobium sp. ABcell2]|uniref:GNAT family N-acetyltransferase n=1 Tax=Marinimicrobium sp. ABcell2 TaxID=3069751 RepID=UPI0027B53A6E|nr:GNAT family N-acetyltransferase [Marinimicrobium sp. ABcell2]MDQ2076761.1 GNAT family N-acetyltransferase [Marinimicrobium sp. ABcell2]